MAEMIYHGLLDVKENIGECFEIIGKVILFLIILFMFMYGIPMMMWMLGALG